MGLDEDILEEKISLIGLRKALLEKVRNKSMQEIELITNIINFYYLILETKTNVPNNGYHT